MHDDVVQVAVAAFLASARRKRALDVGLRDGLDGIPVLNALATAHLDVDVLLDLQTCISSGAYEGRGKRTFSPNSI